jgi:uncharacterized membrane protein YfcA
VDQPLLFALIVFGAITVASTIGFGAMILTVILASHFVPLKLILASVVPLNLLVAAWLGWRDRAHMDRGLILKLVAPWMAVGAAAGLWLSTLQGDVLLKFLFALLVLGLAGRELWRLRGPQEASGAPLPGPLAVASLLLGGLIHGLFASGGPLVVYVVGRQITDKRAFRATLFGIWTLMNVLLLCSYAWAGRLSWESAQLTATLLPSVLGGVALGNWLHHRLDAALFRKLVFVLLGLGALLLAWRSWPQFR